MYRMKMEVLQAAERVMFLLKHASFEGTCTSKAFVEYELNGFVEHVVANRAES